MHQIFEEEWQDITIVNGEHYEQPPTPTTLQPPIRYRNRDVYPYISIIWFSKFSPFWIFTTRGIAPFLLKITTNVSTGI